MGLPDKENMHWGYYLILESDLSELSTAIHFSKDNYGTYSIDLVRQLLTVGSEIDVALKRLCQLLDDNNKYESMAGYKSIIVEKLPELIDSYCEVPQSSIPIFKPWTSLNNQSLDKKGRELFESPAWWSAYNNVKHNRSKYFKEANLGNVIQAVGALYLVNLYVMNFESHTPDYPISNPNILGDGILRFANQETELFKMKTILPSMTGGYY